MYATERLGPKRSNTPEGFLLCEDVPVARTGVLLYSAGELPELDADKDGIIRVMRDPDDVFTRTAMSSGQGKSVTLDHPEDDVAPDNWTELEIGVALNPRRGTGIDDDLMLVDFLIKDKKAIKEINDNGLREVSVGYDAEYEQTEPGKARQHGIIINHFALVEAGRCGPRCAIGDKEMARRPQKRSFADRIMAKFKARDEEGLKEELSKVEDEVGPLGDDGDDESGDGGSGASHVHIHLNGNGTTAKGGTAGGGNQETAVGDNDAGSGEQGTGGEGEQAPAWFAQYSNDVNGRFAKIEAVLAKLSGGDATGGENEGEGGEGAAAGDPTQDEEMEPIETQDEDEGLEGVGDPLRTEDEDLEGENPIGATTRDSAGLKGLFQRTMSQAEILVPGVKFMTFDAKAKAKTTADSLCVFRKRVLKRAMTTDSAKFIKLAAGRTIAPEKLTCDAARTIFTAAAALAANANGSRTHDAEGRATGGHGEAKTTHDLNEANRKFWAAKGGLAV